MTNSGGISQPATSLIAAARRLTSTPTVSTSTRSTPGWAAQAWDFYDNTGEFRYAADWVGSMLSKARLYVADANADGAEVTSGPAFEILDALYGGTEGQSEMLKADGIHLTVAGECYLIGWTAGGQDKWAVVAASELSSRGGNYYISRKRLDSETDPFVMRLWRPHPRKPNEPNAPSRAVLPILSELLGLTKHVASQIDSRLTGAGILWVPKEITFPTRPNTSGDSTRPEANTADQFVDMLFDVASTAVESQESAEARIPIAVTAPRDDIAAVKHMTFSTPLDEQAINLRNEAIRRLALGLDMPPEVLTGSADLNHWNAWAVDDAAIKVHAEPTLALIASSLTEGYLRPLLRDESGVDPQQFYIAADTSAIRLRPNRSQEAIEIYDRGELSAEVLRKETGFDEDDAPDADEQRAWLTKKVAQGSTTPELVAQALRILGADFDVASAGGSGDTTEARPDRSLDDHPTQDMPDLPAIAAAIAPAPLRLGPARPSTTEMAQAVLDAAARAGLYAAAEQMAFRALERAGNRLKTRLNGSRPEGVAASELYLFVPCTTGTVDYLLTDAFTHVERFCPDLGIEPECLTRALDSYCRALLTEQKPHDRDLLGKYLDAATEKCGAPA
jgi:hypothetical protein